MNLVALPDDVDFDTAAALGCRFATAYRAVTQVGRVRPGESVAVHGCGGVGLSAVMIAAARGAQVTAVDPSPISRELAMSLGAAVAASSVDDLHDIDVSIDAFMAAATMRASIACLRPRGRHVQVGLLGEDPTPMVPMELVLARELQLLGSHGMAAHTYPEMLAEIAAGTLRPQALVRDTIHLDAAPVRLMALGEPGGGTGGVTVVHP